MAYSFKQRQDGGFDFFNGNNKTTIEDYTKNTGANQSNLRTMMAQRGDQQSQQIMRQSPVQSKLPSQFTAPKQPTIGDFAGEWLKTAGDFGKNTANFASDVGKGIVNSVGNTIGLLDPTINSQQRDERFQQSIPGAVYRPLDVIGTTLGTSLGAADLSNKGYDPNIITQAMNEQTNRVGINTNADSGVNARKIAGAGLETVLNLATMGNPLTGNLKKQLGAETGKVIEGKAILDALRQSGGNLLPTLMNSSKGQAVTGALSGAASTLQQDTINPSDIIKNAAMGYVGGRVMGAATPLVNKALSGLSSKDSIARSQMVIAKGLDELPAGSPQRQTLIQQMIETTKAKVQASKEEAYLKSPIGRAEQHPSIKGWDANLSMLKSEGEKAIANGQISKAKQIAKAYQDASIKKMNETKALEQKFINQDRNSKQSGMRTAGSFDPTGKLGKEVPKSSLKIDNATPVQKVEFANYVLGRIKKHPVLNDVSRVLTTLRNKDYKNHKQVMDMWKDWSKSNVDTPTPQISKPNPQLETNTPQSRNTNATEQFAIKNGGMDVYGHFYNNEPPSLDTFYFKKGIDGGQGIATTNLNTVIDNFSKKGNKTFTVTDASPEMVDFLKRKEQQGLVKDIGTYSYEGAKNPTPQHYYEITKSDIAPQVSKTPTKTKEIKTAVDSIIQEKYPELSNTEYSSQFPNGIPRIKPSSIKEATGLSAAESGIPPRYLSEANGVALDKVAVEMEYGKAGGQLTMGADDVLDAIKSELDNKKTIRDIPSKIAELRRDPNILAEAQSILQKEKSMYGTPDNTYMPTEKDYQDYLSLLNGKPKSKSLSTPIDNIPAIAKQVIQPKLVKTTSAKAAKTVPQARGFVESVQDASNVNKAVKKSVEGLYTPKTNKQLMGEAQSLLNEGVTIDFKNIKELDKKVAATMQEAINQQAAGNHQAAADLFNNLSEHGTELGRGVQAFSLLKNMSPESVALSVAGRIKKFNQSNPMRKIPELGADQMKIIADKMSEIDLLKPGRDKNIALNELNNTISDFIPSTLVDKGLAVWKAGLLTSLRTQARNFVGNTINGLSEVAKDVPGSIADILMSSKTGKRTLTSNIKGISEFGSKSTRQQMADIFTKGYDPSEQINKFDYKQITWGKNPVEQGLKKYTDIVFRSLGASDKPFYNAAMSRSLYNQAATEAINAGKRGNKSFIDNLVKSPTEDMIKLAISDANTATFKNKNAVNNVVNYLKMGMDKNEFTKLLSGVTMPFTGVPSSILGQIVNYSPVGLLKGIYSTGKVLSGQVPEMQRLAAQEIGRGTIGTGIFALGSYLAGQGLISGQPKDAEEAKQWELENKPRNSILINDRWYSLNSIGPETVVLLAGAKANETLKNPDSSAGQYAVSIGKDFLDQSFVQGIQAPVNALTDPARYGTSYAGQLLSSPIPNIVKDTAKATDNSQREMNSALDYAQSSIPGLRQQLPVKRDVLGNVMKQEPTGVGAFVDLFNSKTPIKNTVVDELSRLNSVGLNSNPSKLSASQTIAGEKVKLTPQELDKLEQDTGTPIREQFNSLMNTAEYKSASDEMKKKALDDIVSTVRDSVKNGVKSGDTTINAASTLTKAQLTLAKDSFDKSGKNYQVVGNTVLRRSADGAISAISKDKYDYQVRSAAMTQQKNKNDLNGWMKTAEEQIKSIDTQLQDPSVDPLDKIQLQNDAQTILDNVSKYQSYGAFTKGKSASTVKKANISAITASNNSINNLTNSTLSSLRSLLSGTRSSSPQVKKAALKKITVRR